MWRRRWAAAFLNMVMTSRWAHSSPAKLADWAKQHPKGRVGSFADAAKFGELVVLAVKGTAAPDVLRAANRDESGRQACH